jgi:hypothetical protein
MKMNFFSGISILSLTLSLFSSLCLYAQSSISAAGGQGLSNAGKVEYTIGQVAYRNYSSASGKINEGVQQPYEILILRIENSEESTLPDVYPNPANDKVYIRFNKLTESVYFELLNEEGKVQLGDKIKDAQTELLMKDLPATIYFLKIYSSNAKCTTFKLIKINK